MATLKQDKERADRGTYLPEHGPIDEKSGKEILLSLKNVDITFGKGEAAVRAVQNATFDIYKGETFSLVGESGSGKTTVGRAVIRVNPLAGGEIQYKGVRISGKIPHALDREVIRNIQMVFQDPAASLNERATVDYIISEGLYNFHLFDNEADRVRRVEEMINEVGLLPEHLTRYPHEFSGGQRQRIGIARAMVMEPELFNYLSEDENCILERRPMETLAQEGCLGIYKHGGFWQCMDTQRDKIWLEERWKNDHAPWRVW